MLCQSNLHEREICLLYKFLYNIIHRMTRVLWFHNNFIFVQGIIYRCESGIECDKDSFKFAANGVIWHNSSNSSYSNKDVSNQKKYNFGLIHCNYYKYKSGDRRVVRRYFTSSFNNQGSNFVGTIRKKAKKLNNISFNLIKKKV